MSKAAEKSRRMRMVSAASVMVDPEIRLERFKELMVGQVMLKLGNHCSFQDTDEREVGDWMIVVGVIRV